MAVLTDTERNSALSGFVRKAFVDLRERADFDVIELKAAIAAIDDLLDAQTSAINQAFPEPFKSNATISQKALVVAYVAMKRGGVI